MSLFTDANLEIGYFDARPVRGEVPAQVAFEDGGMTLVVGGEGANAPPVVYQGKRRGQGHYLLSSESDGFAATLHRFAESTILEGFWRSDRERGFWRLHLPVDAVLPAPAPAARPRRNSAARVRSNGSERKKAAPRRARTARRRHAPHH